MLETCGGARSRRGGTLPNHPGQVPQARLARQRPSEGRPVLTIVPEESDGRDERAAAGGSSSLIDEIVREGARRMLTEALGARGGGLHRPLRRRAGRER